MRGEIRRSPRVRRLLDGRAEQKPGTYDKWRGTHWVLAALADLGHPAGDDRLFPLRDALLRGWLGAGYFREFDPAEPGGRRAPVAVPVLAGRYRRCGPQQGSALLSVVRLGLDDGRAAQLVERLVHRQWPFGGWNCDRRPGWPAEARYYRGFGERRGGFDHVDWGGVGSRRMNEWVTADAMAVLAAAGR